MGTRRHSDKNQFYLGNFWFVSQNKIFPKKICKNLKNPRFLKVFLKNLQKPKEKYIFFQNKNGNQKQISFLKNVCFYCVLPYKTALGGSWWGAWPYIYILSTCSTWCFLSRSPWVWNVAVLQKMSVVFRLLFCLLFVVVIRNECMRKMSKWKAHEISWGGSLSVCVCFLWGFAMLFNLNSWVEVMKSPWKKSEWRELMNKWSNEQHGCTNKQKIANDGFGRFCFVFLLSSWHVSEKVGGEPDETKGNSTQRRWERKKNRHRLKQNNIFVLVGMFVWAWQLALFALSEASWSANSWGVFISVSLKDGKKDM